MTTPALATQLRRILKKAPISLYQTHTLDGHELNVGIRGVERRALVDLADVRGRRVLDLGCATGAESLWAAEMGATHVLGIDVGVDQIEVFQWLRLAWCAKKPTNVECLRWDLRFGLPPDLVEFDTVFAFAIAQHIGYLEVWQQVSAARVAYVEGGTDCPFTEASLSTNGWTATLIGRTPCNRARPGLERPLFRLVRL